MRITALAPKVSFYVNNLTFALIAVFPPTNSDGDALFACPPSTRDAM